MGNEPFAQNLAFWEAQALLWDQCVRPRPDDVSFFVAQAQQSGSPVLEIGCGTGRSLIPMAEAGLQVVGLDLSHAMLARAREKAAPLDPAVRQRIALLQGDMAAFALGRRFNLILVTYAFVFLTSVAAQRRALACMAQHLAEGGRLILTNPDPKPEEIAAGPGGAALREPRMVTHPQTKRQVMIRSSREYDPLAQTVQSTFVFEELDEQGAVLAKRYRHLHSRYTYRYETEHLLELCGYRVEALFGDFQGKAFAPGDTQIWVLRRWRDGIR